MSDYGDVDDEAFVELDRLLNDNGKRPFQYVDDDDDDDDFIPVGKFHGLPSKHEVPDDIPSHHPLRRPVAKVQSKLAAPVKKSWQPYKRLTKLEWMKQQSWYVAPEDWRKRKRQDLERLLAPAKRQKKIHLGKGPSVTTQLKLMDRGVSAKPPDPIWKVWKSNPEHDRFLDEVRSYLKPKSTPRGSYSAVRVPHRNSVIVERMKSIPRERFSI